MKKGLLALILLVVFALPACGAPLNTSGSWGVDAAGFKNLSTALASPSTAGKTVVISSPMAINNKTTDRAISITAAGRINVASGKTLNINGPLTAGVSQIFAGAGTVNFAAGAAKEVYPEWWSTDGSAAAFRAAVASLPVSGGIVKLQGRAYRSPFDTNGTKLIKDNITIIGSGTPTFAANGLSLEGGTIIKGTFWLYAHNLHMENFGVDCGETVTADYYGGVGVDGFLIAADITHPPATDPWKGFVAKNIVALAKNPTAAVHAFLCENVIGAYVENIRVKFGTHGIVFKSLYSNATGLFAEDCASDGVIIKSDSYGAAGASNFSNIVIKSTTQGLGGGLIVEASTADHRNTNISNVNIDNTSFGFVFTRSAPSILEHIHVSGFAITNVIGYGLDVREGTRYINIDNGSVANGVGTGLLIRSTADYIRAMNVLSTNNSMRGFDLRGINSKLISCTAKDNAGLGLYMEGDQWTESCVFVNNTAGDMLLNGSNRLKGIYTSPTTTLPALLNSWAQHGGGDGVRWWIEQGQVQLKGLVTSGTVGTTIFVLPDGFRPLETKRFPVLCHNGSAGVLGELLIDASGNVVLVFGANSYVSLNGIRFSLTAE